eukprot:3636275-Prymnesium_polylepis.2
MRALSDRSVDVNDCPASVCALQRANAGLVRIRFIFLCLIARACVIRAEGYGPYGAKHWGVGCGDPSRRRVFAPIASAP